MPLKCQFEKLRYFQNILEEESVCACIFAAKAWQQKKGRLTGKDLQIYNLNKNDSRKFDLLFILWQA